MFDRIVVGTDGSETATEAVRTAVELAKLSKAKLEIVSAYEPVPHSRLRDEGEGITGDVSHTVNPREDVQLVLGQAAAVAKKAKVEVVTHPREGEPADAILDVANPPLIGRLLRTESKAYLSGLAATRSDPARETIPLRQACGRYVDWYAVAPGTPEKALRGVVAPQAQPIEPD